MTHTRPELIERLLADPLPAVDDLLAVCIVCGVEITSARIHCDACVTPPLSAAYLAARRRLRDRLGETEQES